MKATPPQKRNIHGYPENFVFGTQRFIGLIPLRRKTICVGSLRWLRPSTPQFRFGYTNMLVSKNAKIYVTPNAKSKICVNSNAKPQCESVDYRPLPTWLIWRRPTPIVGQFLSADSSGFRILNMFNKDSWPTITEPLVE